FEASIDQLAQIRPVAEVPSRPVDLVDHYTGPSAIGQGAHEARKLGAPALRGRLLFFEPFRNREVVLTGVSFNRRTLFWERDTLFTLAGRRHTDIGTKRFH